MPRLNSDPKAVGTANPIVVRLVKQELERGAGRNMTETLENLVIEAAAHRRVERVRAEVTAERSQTVPA